MTDEKVAWQPWTAETFARAEDADKPVLLDLDATWCHWCHVMEETTYSDAEVVRLVNSEFVPIRVDPDRHPEINDRYNQGGWPTTAFLAPTGEILFGATYVPPEQMRAILQKLIDMWKTKRSEMRSAVEAMRLRQEAPQELSIATRDDGGVPAEMLEAAFARCKDYYDEIHGGFGAPENEYAPKFPFPETLEICLLQFAQTGSQEAAEMATKSLQGLLKLEDREEGGFFRYAVKRDWTEPHYEKMLETNAALLRIFLSAWFLLRDKRYYAAAAGIINWSATTMLSPQRSFYGSQDADGESEYYDKSKAARAKLSTPAVDKTIFCDWNAQMARALLEAFILLGEMTPLQLGLSALEWLLAKCHHASGAMFHYYADDKTHLLGRLRDQAEMILALSRAYQVTAEAHNLQAGEELAQFVIQQLEDKALGGFFDIPASTRDNPTAMQPRKNIIDNAVMAEALLDLAALTGKKEYRQYAESALSVFREEEIGMTPFAAGYAHACWRFHAVQPTVVVVGGREEELASMLLMQALGAGFPFTIAQLLDPKIDTAKLQQLNLPTGDGVPKAYLCGEGSCQKFDSPEALGKALVQAHR
jgi:uncharacterized protein